MSMFCNRTYKNQKTGRTSNKARTKTKKPGELRTSKLQSFFFAKFLSHFLLPVMECSYFIFKRYSLP